VKFFDPNFGIHQFDIETDSPEDADLANSIAATLTTKGHFLKSYHSLNSFMINHDLNLATETSVRGNKNQYCGVLFAALNDKLTNKPYNPVFWLSTTIIAATATSASLGALEIIPVAAAVAVGVGVAIFVSLLPNLIGLAHAATAINYDKTTQEYSYTIC
jgi:hypothetical protein